MQHPTFNFNFKTPFDEMYDRVEYMSREIIELQKEIFEIKRAGVPMIKILEWDKDVRS